MNSLCVCTVSCAYLSAVFTFWCSRWLVMREICAGSWSCVAWWRLFWPAGDRLTVAWWPSPARLGGVAGGLAGGWRGLLAIRWLRCLTWQWLLAERTGDRAKSPLTEPPPPDDSLSLFALSVSAEHGEKRGGWKSGRDIVLGGVMSGWWFSGRAICPEKVCQWLERRSVCKRWHWQFTVICGRRTKRVRRSVDMWCRCCETWCFVCTLCGRGPLCRESHRLLFTSL